jgi:uncharacterized membrane protein
MIKPRIGGQPLHIILAHFPSALFPMSVACSSLFYFSDNIWAGHAAFYNLMAGAGTAWLTIVFGLWESLLVPADKTKAIAIILLHATFNGLATILFSIWASKAWHEYPEFVKDSTTLLIFKWIAVAMLIIGNYFGGKLLIVHHIGVTPPKSDEG